MIVTPFAQVRIPYAPHLTCLIAVNGSKRQLISAVNLSSSPPHLLASSLPLSSSLLLLSLPRCPSIPQVLASLRTVRSNFTILANVTTPTNKSVSCCQTPLPSPLNLSRLPASFAVCVRKCLGFLDPMGKHFSHHD